jgi:predicted GNAT superfamily acetyltransferase
MLTLRDYRPEDLPTLHEINESCYPGVGTETYEGLGAIVDESVIALVAEVDGEIAGFCLVLEPDADYDSINFIWFNEQYDDHVYLDRVAIAERFHRKGIGRAMYTEVERLLAERCANAKWLALEVNLEPRNDQSLGFHEALGFREVGQQQTDYGAFVSLMTKPINAA